MRFSLAALLLLVAIVAASVATATTFWDPGNTNYPLLLGVFLLVVCLSIVSAIFGGVKFRPAFAGTSLFGIVYLVFVLQGGFGLQYIQDAQAMVKKTTIGFPLLGIAFLATHFIVMVLGPPANKERNNIDPPGVL
jgi:hypothetical protein